MAPIPAVQRQYETLPYPPRDPEDERRRLQMPVSSHIALVNHVFWQGRRDVRAGLRVLDAGCGTGDAAVFLGEQLRDTPSEIVALDISAASLEIARRRAEARGLANVRFLQAEIEHIVPADLGRFDFIVSSGVLHHLPSPERGLAALSGVLAPRGGLAILVYGRHGRQHIYQVQQLLRLVAPDTLPADERIAIAKQLLVGLRPEHWANLGRGSWAGEIDQHGESGLFDLFLHSQDRAYTVPEIYGWLQGAGFALVRWDLPILYDPATYLPGVDLSALPGPQRHEAAELLNGRMSTHLFFAAQASSLPEPVPALSLGAVPTWLLWNTERVVTSQLRDRRELEIAYNGMEKRILLDPFTRAILRRVDGETLLGTLLEEIGVRFKTMKRAEIEQRWEYLYDQLETLNLLGLFASA